MTSLRGFPVSRRAVSDNVQGCRAGASRTSDEAMLFDDSRHGPRLRKAYAPVSTGAAEGRGSGNRLLAGGGPRELRGSSSSDANPPDDLRDPTDASHLSHVVTDVFDNPYRAESRAPVKSRSIGAVPCIEGRVPRDALGAENHRVLSGPRPGSEGAYCEAPATVCFLSVCRARRNPYRRPLTG
jgi:hypothetical protein